MNSGRTTLLLIAVCATALAGCGNDRFSFGGSPAEPPPIAAGKGPGARIAPPVNLAGRWTLSQPGGGSCAFTLNAIADATEGTIAPAGGCPLNFFTSRKWTYEDTGLVIRDHNAQPLAQLTQAAPNRFEGTATSGQSIALTR
jgi:hypothetical protein